MNQQVAQPPQRKRGRPKGSKNRPKDVIEAERHETLRAAEVPLTVTMQFEDEPMSSVLKRLRGLPGRLTLSGELRSTIHETHD